MDTGKAQMVSDSFHEVTDDIDRLMAKIAGLTALSTEIRIEAQMGGVESQRVLKHLAATQPHLADARNAVTLAHAAAQKDAPPKADFPWDCPEQREQQAPVRLATVNE